MWSSPCCRIYTVLVEQSAVSSPTNSSNTYSKWREGGREEGREGGREEGREGGREEGREGGREGGRERELIKGV